jgi:hypothetical protein
MAVETIMLMTFIQLLVVSCIGFACIYFGYRLFAQIPIETTNEGHVKMPKLGEVKLKVAPGIFFALLGAAIILYSLVQSTEIRTDGYTIRQNRHSG